MVGSFFYFISEVSNWETMLCGILPLVIKGGSIMNKLIKTLLILLCAFLSVYVTACVIDNMTGSTYIYDFLVDVHIWIFAVNIFMATGAVLGILIMGFGVNRGEFGMPSANMLAYAGALLLLHLLSPIVDMALLAPVNMNSYHVECYNPHDTNTTRPLIMAHFFKVPHRDLVLVNRSTDSTYYSNVNERNGKVETGDITLCYDYKVPQHSAWDIVCDWIDNNTFSCVLLSIIAFLLMAVLECALCIPAWEKEKRNKRK